jgi:hypothetical protein
MKANKVSSTQFEPSLYPLTYANSKLSAVLGAIIGIALFVAGLICAFLFATSSAFLLGLFIVAALAGAYVALSSTRAKIVLKPDEITVQGVFFRDQLRRDNIAGCRTWTYRTVKHIELKSKPGAGKGFEFSMPFKEDNAFKAWFAGLEDLDPPKFPRTYKSSKVMSVVGTGAGSLLTIAGLVGFYFIATADDVLNAGFSSAILFATTLAGLYYALSSARAKIVLYADEVVVQGAFLVKRIRREEIASKRIWTYKNVKHIQLKLKHSKGSGFEFSMPYAEDDTFRAWFKPFKNQDDLDFVESIQEIEKDESLGPTPAARLDNIRRSNKIAFLLIPVSLIGMAWAMIYPHPYLLVVGLVASLPWIVIALAWTYRNSFSIEDKGDKSARIDLTFVVLIPGIILMLRALDDVNLIAPGQVWARLMAVSIAGSILMAGLALLATPLLRKQPAKALLYVLLLVPYVASVTMISNQLLDTSEPNRSFVHISGSHEEKSSHGGRSYYLTVDEWFANSGKREMEVEKDFYETYGKGDTVCLHRRPGVYGFEWFSIHEKNSC